MPIYADKKDEKLYVTVHFVTVTAIRIVSPMDWERKDQVNHMDMNAISKVTAATPATVTTATARAASETQEKKTASTAEELGVVYEKSKDTDKVTTAKDNKAIIAKLKADAEARTAQMRSLVEQMMTKQGTAYANANDMWKFLAKGDFTVSADVKAQAQADIAEDGYWGVEQTSDRILDFAKALGNNDPEKAEEMLEAFKKGFKQAEKAWGNELPEISQKTYDAVLEKFEAWKNETATETETV